MSVVSGDGTPTDIAGTGAEPGLYDVDRPAPLEATLNRVIALRVKEARQRKGLPMGHLSEQTGISKGMLSKIENGQISPSLTTLQVLVRRLNLPMTSLFTAFEDKRDCSFVPAGQGVAIRLSGDPDPHLFDDVDPAKAAAFPMEEAMAFQQALLGQQLRWTVVAAPNPGWAREIFGEPVLDGCQWAA